MTTSSLSVVTPPVAFDFTTRPLALSTLRSFFRSGKYVYHSSLPSGNSQSRFQAFIDVLGVHGLLVDNCQVFPASTTTHTTIPLTNNSELEISKKRFRFEYPPKAIRPVLAFTPPPHVSQSARKRVLRLSMIQSAQVF